jgi:cytochrome c-type biogenesis protein CcmH/NrfG
MLPEAKADLDAAIAREPEHAEALGLLAECCLRLGDAEAALEHGMASAALAISNPRVHLTIGRAFVALGSLQDAVVAFEAACALGPGWDEAQRALAEVRSRL